jgi:PqqD family protein of HPr-rel-A system
MTAEPYFRAEPGDALLVQPLDDIVLLYHRPSGQTHMVASPVPEILAALRALGDASASAIHDALARDFDLGPPDAAVPEIATHLAEMTALGVVRQL